MTDQELRDGEVIPAIADFLKSVKLKSSARPIPEAVDYYGRMWVTLEEANDLDDDEVIEIVKVNNKMYHAPCPGCNGFRFERTAIQAMRDWLQEHNRREHKGKLKLYDSTAEYTPGRG